MATGTHHPEYPSKSLHSISVTKEPTSCGGPSRSYARALSGRGDPQLTSQVDYVRHRHLRRATQHPPLNQHSYGRLSSIRPATACSFSITQWTGLISHEPPM
jgi:hypothetical protein